MIKEIGLNLAPGNKHGRNKPKQEARSEPQQDGKRVIKNGGYTIPAQMF
jgi:hypothetical protein